MYGMKGIVPIDSSIDLPTCMYNMRNPTQGQFKDDIDIKICDQKTSNKVMLDLEERQQQLLKKLDNLYDQIKLIRSSCKYNDELQDISHPASHNLQVNLNEVVITLNPDNLPWFLKTLLKRNSDLKYTWHIHSSIPSNKIVKILSFFKNLGIPQAESDVSQVNLRLIFKQISATAELKTSSLGLPIRGNINILRYFCEQYPNTALYNYNDYEMESLLDTCYLLENSEEPQKPALCKKLFPHDDTVWFFKGQLSIVDLAVYNVIKQSQNYKKLVPHNWLSNCQKFMEK